MSIIRAMREESETIKFDNLFSNDLENEREFDLIFAAEQDDEDLKSIAGNAILKEDGDEKVFNLPDCVYVNEDGEVKDKDDEVDDLSDDDIAEDKSEEAPAEEPAPEAPAAAPSVVVNVDAEDVNINAGEGGTSVDADPVKEESENEITINAKVVNMTANANAAGEAPAAAPAPEPAAVAPEAPAEDDEEDIELIAAPAPEEPAGAEEEVPAAEPEAAPETDAEVEVDSKEVEVQDNDEVIPGSDDDGEPVATGEAAGGVEDIYTPSQLEDILNSGLEPAPAPEPTTPTNTPDDPSTEVVFSDNPDIEVKDSGVNEAELTAVKDDENLEPAKKIEGEFEDDLAPVTDKNPEAEFNKLPEDEVKKELDIEPVKPEDLPTDDGSVSEAGEPTKNTTDKAVAEAGEPTKNTTDKAVAEAGEPTKNTPDVVVTEEEDISLIEEDNGDPTEGDAPQEDSPIPQADDPKHTDTSALNKPYDKEAIEDKEDAAAETEELDIALIGEASEDEDPMEKYVDQDAKDSLEGIEPGVTDGDLISMYVEKPVDPSQKNDGKLAEAEEIKAVKDDENLEPAKKIEGEFEDDLAPVTDKNPEAEFNKLPEDETKEELDIEPIKPEDLPTDDGSVSEAGEPTKNTTEKAVAEAGEPTKNTTVKEADGDQNEEVDASIDSKEASENDYDISPIGPAEVTPDEVNAPEEDMEYDKVAAEKPEERHLNNGSDPAVNTVAEADFMDQVNALDNGDNFADTMNTGLNITPEEVEPGSDEELIDDEAIAIIEDEA